MVKTLVKLQALAIHLRRYLKAELASAKLAAADKISGLVADITAAVLAGIVFLLCLIFASVSLSVAVGGWIGRAWAGFLVVAGGYLFIGIIVWKARGKLIRRPVMNTLVKKLSKPEEDN